MAISSRYINVKFTGTGSDFEILTDTNVQVAMKKKLNITDDDDYTAKLLVGIPDLDFTIYATGTRASVNGNTYNEGEFIEDTVFQSGDYLREKIKSIKLETGVTGILNFNILG